MVTPSFGWDSTFVPTVLSLKSVTLTESSDDVGGLCSQRTTKMNDCSGSILMIPAADAVTETFVSCRAPAP
jgi:hypothetical protein